MVRNAFVGAVLVEEVLTAYAESRFEATSWVIDTGVDDLGIARRCFFADSFVAFEHDDIASGERKFAGDCKPDYTRTDDNYVEGFIHEIDLSYLLLEGEGRNRNLLLIDLGPRAISGQRNPVLSNSLFILSSLLFSITNT
tara:strand:- start:222 stop:641 length:420 start_codon:yes stop_codon:yes gene_type:complete